jgi:hypothetical protein
VRRIGSNPGISSYSVPKERRATVVSSLRDALNSDHKLSPVSTYRGSCRAAICAFNPGYRRIPMCDHGSNLKNPQKGHPV